MPSPALASFSSGRSILPAAQPEIHRQPNAKAAMAQAPSRPAIFDYDELHEAISALRKKQVFFIGGTPKSGTTWLQLLLNAHPQVSANGEGHFMDLLAPALRMAVAAHEREVKNKNTSIFNELGGYPRLTETDILYLTASAVALFLMAQSRHKAASAVGEKTPDNLLLFARFHTLFPAAKFIQIIRDGRDCAVSAWFHNLRVNPHWVMSEFGSVDAFACKYAGHWAANLAAAQDFADAHPDHVRQIRYEELVADTPSVLAGLFGFLGVAASMVTAQRCVAEASFVRLSGGRNPGDEDRRSFFRKGIPGDWRNHLGAETNARFVKAAGSWLRRFGYA
jgi:hypothetical protein